MRTSDPTVRAVFLEDAAALIGIVIAVVGIAGHQLTELRLSLVGAGKVFLSGAVDLVGNADERTAAIQLAALERRLIKNPYVVLALISLSSPDDESLVPHAV